MKEYDFTLILEKLDLTTDVENAVFEAGCDDGTLGISGGVPQIMFTREATSLREAISSAIDNARTAGLEVVEVRPEEENRSSADLQVIAEFNKALASQV